jgi:putative tricarboxylic transport membrane protein
MKVSDSLSGALAVIFGIALILYSRTFPAMPGQAIGPGLFPSVIAWGLVGFGGALIVAARRQPRVAPVEFDDWVRRPRMVLNFAVVIVALVFYATAVNRLGFFLTAAIFVSVLWTAFGVRRRLILPLALAVTFAVHYMFYSVLRVPLPWGPLGDIAW